MLQLAMPLIKYRFRVIFFDVAGNNIGKDVLTPQLISFKYDIFKKEFNMLFRLPATLVKSFEKSILSIDSFDLDYLNGEAEEAIDSKNFRINKITQGYIKLDYSSADEVVFELHGIYI
jgi:hypothetical protein